MPMSDESGPLGEVLRSAGRGDRRPLMELFDSYRPRLRRMIRLRLDERLRGRIDASDIVQEAYLEASAKLDDYLQQRPLPPFAWLRSLAIRKLAALHRRHLGTKVRDAHREMSLYRDVLPEAGSRVLANQLLGPLTSPSMAAQRAEHRLRLQQALASINPIDREVLMLRHFEELTNNETAEVLGISKSAAWSRHLRALKHLRRALAELPGGIEGFQT
jgi:RNA polymerase sigma-70 factor (ECF subfamily)